MFYLYFNGDLISCCETFTEVYDVIVKEILSYPKSLCMDDNFFFLLPEFCDYLIRTHHAGFNTSYFDEPIQIEVWYG